MSGGVTLTLGGDVALILPNGFVFNNDTFTRSSTHNLWVIRPDPTVESPPLPTCPSNATDGLTNGFIISNKINVMIYDPCTVAVSSGIKFSGQIFAGKTSIDGSRRSPTPRSDFRATTSTPDPPRPPRRRATRGPWCPIATSVVSVAVVVGIFGALIGSFLNVVIYRVPLKRSIVSPPSACGSCGHRVRGYDNIPLVSWLVLRGRCRDCGSRISVRYPLVELGAPSSSSSSRSGRCRRSPASRRSRPRSAARSSWSRSSTSPRSASRSR